MYSDNYKVNRCINEFLRAYSRAKHKTVEYSVDFLMDNLDAAETFIRERNVISIAGFFEYAKRKHYEDWYLPIMQVRPLHKDVTDLIETQRQKVFRENLANGKKNLSLAELKNVRYD